MLAVVCYLALFRLDELGMAHFRKFVSSQDINRMYRVRIYLFNFIKWCMDGFYIVDLYMLNWTDTSNPIYYSSS